MGQNKRSIDRTEDLLLNRDLTCHVREGPVDVYSNAVKYVLFANTVLILIQYFLGQMSVLRDGLVQTLTNSSPNIGQIIACVSPASWPNG